MAIDDNTIYGLYGSQIKDLPEKINAVKGKAKVLTSADYNWPENNPDGVALWKLGAGCYVPGDYSVHIYTNSSTSPSDLNVLYLVGNTVGDRCPILRIGSTLATSYLYNTGVASGGGFVYKPFVDVVNSLTSTTTDAALSAAQGKVLKDLIDSIATRGAGAPTTSTVGQVGTLYEDTTNGDLYICTDATNPYVWEEVGAGGSGPTVVQTTGTSTTDVMSQNATTSMVFANPSSKTQVQIGNGANAAANTGNATIAIGNNAKAYQPGSDESSSIYTMAVGVEAVAKGNRSLALGANSSAAYTGSVAVGAGANTTSVGQFDIGTRYDSYGYNSSNYRLLTGVYDPQTAHDAATKGYVDNSLLGKQDALTAGDGITIEDESGSLVISATSSGPTVVQTTGSSTTDVMSQNAVTSMVYNDPVTRRRVNIGGSSSATGNWTVAIGDSAYTSSTNAIAVMGNAQGEGSIAIGVGATTSSGKKSQIALGSYSGTTAQGEMNIGCPSYNTYGYNNSAYRLLTGLYDPQSAHDAATKGYVDTAVGAKQDVLTAGDNITIAEESGALVISATGGSSIDTFTTNEWNALWA